MKITGFKISKFNPIRLAQTDGLKDLVVIAGPNGVGKTKLLDLLIRSFKEKISSDYVELELGATCEEEENFWKKRTIKTFDDYQILESYLNKERIRGRLKGGVLRYDSIRSSSFTAENLHFRTEDPLKQLYSAKQAMDAYSSRYSDTINSIFKILLHDKLRRADEQEQRKRAGEETMALDFGDPLQEYRDVFHKLLGPKKLPDYIDVGSQRLQYILDGQPLDINTLSSGELEVFKFVFDLLLRKPEDSIIFIDEPELHLHPELTRRLLNTLNSIGRRNQFVLFTHSANIISDCVDGSVLSMRPPIDEETNQIIEVTKDKNSMEELQKLGQHIGVISLGKKILLVEGESTSTDYKTYNHLLEEKYPGFVLTPCTGRDMVISFSKVVNEIINKKIWGVDFFMLADRDANLPEYKIKELENLSEGRLRFLPRYHIENYFLDEKVIKLAFGKHCDWVNDEASLKSTLVEFAKEQHPFAVNLIVRNKIRRNIGNIDIGGKKVQQLSEDDLTKIFIANAEQKKLDVNQELESTKLKQFIHEEWSRLQKSIDDGSWKTHFPCKPIIGRLASKLKVDSSIYKSMYIQAAKDVEYSPFSDITTIIEKWN